MQPIEPDVNADTATSDQTRDFELAHDRFFQALRQSGASIDGQREISRAHDVYMELLKTAWAHDDVREPVERAYQGYLHSLRDLFTSSEAVQGCLERAFRNYVEELQVGWSRVDASSISVNEVATMGGRLLSVASIAHAGLVGS